MEVCSTDCRVIFMGEGSAGFFELFLPPLRILFFKLPAFIIEDPPVAARWKSATVGKKRQGSDGDNDGDGCSNAPFGNQQIDADDNKYDRPHAEYRSPVEIDYVQVVQ